MSVLLIDGDQHSGHSASRLNHTLHQTTRDTLAALGHAVKETVIEEGYSKNTEMEKWLQMNAVVWQAPGWWMSEPWTVRRYVDGVSAVGIGENKLVVSDGRHRVNPTEGYGTGDLLHGERHMISSIWNAPIEVSTREGDFFEGAGVDGVCLHFRRTNEFLGTIHLPSFICNDVVKNPQVEQYLAGYRTHLEKVLDREQKPQVGHECPIYQQ